MTGVVDVATLQTLARRDDVSELLSEYGLVVVDECHHVPAAAVESVVRTLPARHWLGLTATPYRMGARARATANERLVPAADGSPLVVVATGHSAGEGFDCPVLDTLFLAGPVSFEGRLVQYAGRVLRSHPGKQTAEVHDYHDVETPVLAAALTKRAPGYLSLGFPDPRRT